MKRFLSIGLVRGLLHQAIGTAIGIGLVTLIQAVEGKPLNPEPAWVVGGIDRRPGFYVGRGRDEGLVADCAWKSSSRGA